jgi:hypothetical protein
LLSERVPKIGQRVPHPLKVIDAQRWRHVC